MGRTRRMLWGLVALAVAAATACGGTLATDPNAYQDTTKVWRGSVDMSTGDLSATVDWAVFHQDDWTYGGYTVQGDPNFPGLDVFVYAYQVFSTGSDQLTRTFVSMLESNEAFHIATFIVDPGDTDAMMPDGVGFEGTPVDTANWRFEPGLVDGQHSVGLVYSSVNAPLMWIGSIQDGGAVAAGMVGSPSDQIPEPGAAVLLTVGVLGLIRRRRR